jgi:hypothetical protein
MSEHFTSNRSINNALNEMLAAFPEPSPARMRKKLRQNNAILREQATPEADANARHTFREFVPAWQLFNFGFNLEYERPIAPQKTPDWFDETNRFVLEVFTCERGGNQTNVEKRVSDTISGKVCKYREAVVARSLHFVVGVHGDFHSNFDQIDCQDAALNGSLFSGDPDLSGVIFFAETKVVEIPQPDGTRERKQLYGFTYFANPIAARPIDLSDTCN